MSDLVNAKRSYPPAVPVLLGWLERLDAVPRHERGSVREMLIRALTVPAARGSAAPALIEEFRRAEDPSEFGIRWVIANALSVVADGEVFNDLVELALDRSYGRAREMLMLALARTRDPRAVAVLVDMLDDEVVAGHAVMALGQLKEREARAAIEPFLDDERPWVRKEAKKALAKLA